MIQGLASSYGGAASLDVRVRVGVRFFSSGGGGWRVMDLLQKRGGGIMTRHLKDVRGMMA